MQCKSQLATKNATNKNHLQTSHSTISTPQQHPSKHHIIHTQKKPGAFSSHLSQLPQINLTQNQTKKKKKRTKQEPKSSVTVCSNHARDSPITHRQIIIQTVKKRVPKIAPACDAISNSPIIF